MSTIKLSATEMTDAEVFFISLVDRGANRIPFKITKKEKSMAGSYSGLDLASFFHTTKAEDPTPQVVGVVTMEGEQFDAAKAVIERAGFSVDCQQNLEDGSVVFKQEGAEIDTHDLIIKISDTVALVTKGFRPYDMELDIGNGSTFSEACNASGFYPGIRTVMDALSNSIGREAERAPTPDMAADKIGALFDEAKAYVQSLVSNLPQKAFKLEQLSLEPEDALPKEDPIVETPAEAPAEIVQDEATPAEVPVAVQSIAISDALIQKMEERFAGLALTLKSEIAAVSVHKEFGELSEAVKALSERVGKAESKANEAQVAITGTVVLGSESGDTLPMAIKKSLDAGYKGREIDTAFMPHIRKRSSR